jgi:hypothetical protein
LVAVVYFLRCSELLLSWLRRAAVSASVSGRAFANEVVDYPLDVLTTTIGPILWAS